MSFSQNYFEAITKTPTEISSENILQRMIDGLGFRYYWATDSLRDADLNFRPSPDARTCEETLVHLYNLSFMIKTSVFGEEFERKKLSQDLPYPELRNLTLENLQLASEKLASQNIENIEITFSNGNKLPVWNLINGPISDAIYHTGQIVSFRRTSGNPINKNVNVLLGKIN
jgi:hypothetical protein